MRHTMLAVLSIALAISSCASGGYNYTGNPNPVPVYLPYVESIETDPAVVQLGEPYDVIANVSCQLNPSLLRGGPPDHPTDQSTARWHWTELYGMNAQSISEPGRLILAFHPWVISPAETGEIVQSFKVVTVPRAIAGTRTFQILTADSSEWGGLESTYYGTPTPMITTHVHAVYREFEITVLSAEE